MHSFLIDISLDILIIIMRIVRKISQEITNGTLYLKSSLLPHAPVISNNVTFASQFANPQWAEKILKDKLSKTSDPDWVQSGAVSVEEYETWVTTTCGMACTVMALDYFKKGTCQTIMLAKDALTHQVYHEHAGKLSNMCYREYVHWVKKYHLSAQVYSKLTLNGLKYLLSNQVLVMVSVNPNIRGYATASKEQVGGHLVLVTGYNDTNGTITLHNPSGFVSSNTHYNHTMDYRYFETYFAGRGITLANLA